MYVLVLLVVIAGQPVGVAHKASLDKPECIELGKKMTEDFAKATNGKGKTLWGCFDSSEKTL